MVLYKFQDFLYFKYNLTSMQRKDKDFNNSSDEQPFEVMTKMPPPFGKPPKPFHNLGNQQTPKKNYEPMNWDLFFDDLSYLDDGTSIFRAGTQGALFFCIHGAGHSALSFAALARQVKNFGTLVSFDFKGHGYSKKKQNLQDFSIQTLVAESIEVLKQIMDRYPEKNVVIIGHSMGGSVACRLTHALTNKQKQPRIVGCVIIDVVQGTAIEALPFMNQILNEKPKHFESLESAIKWSLTTNQLKKVESARVSIPPQLVEQKHNGKIRYTWKVDLKETEKFWLGWFKGLTPCFLGIHIPKILVTAQKERMDKQLTIAQMQGKFKLTVLHNVGHSVQEDDFKGTARMLYDFLKDFRIPMTLQEVSEKQLIGIAKFHPNLNKY